MLTLRVRDYDLKPAYKLASLPLVNREPSAAESSLRCSMRHQYHSRIYASICYPISKTWMVCFPRNRPEPVHKQTLTKEKRERKDDLEESQGDKRVWVEKGKMSDRNGEENDSQPETTTLPDLLSEHVPSREDRGGTPAWPPGSNASQSVVLTPFTATRLRGRVTVKHHIRVGTPICGVLF